jgi:Spy/CpxP family protein refolding chaperone
MKPTITHLLSLALLCALGMSTPASAQQSTPTPPPKAATPSKAAPSGKLYGNADEPENNATLYLTDDQKTRIKAIRADADQQIQAAEKDPALTPEQKDRRVKQIRKATRAQVFAVLTPDQQKIWSAEQREKREAKSSPPPKAQ